MGFEHLYGRIVTATLGTLLGICAFLAGAKFIRNRVKLISLLVKAQGALFAVLMGGVAATTMITASVKDPPTNQVQHMGFPRLMPRVQLRSGNGQSQITETNVADGYRVVVTREGCEIVGRDAFDAPQIYAPWLARGGYKDKTRIALSGWTFPWRDGILEGITVFSEGKLRPNVHTNYFPMPFDAPLAVVPSFNWNLLPGGISNVFWHAVSPSNSLIVTWENAPVNRDVNSITNFQAELFANGSFEYRYDDRTVGYSRVHPLDLDFDGLPNTIDPEPEIPLGASVWNQSEAWAAVAFPSNAAEIASVGGYAAWVMQRASDPNRRLVGLNIALQGGRWPVCVEVGGVPVMADSNAELLFAIDCGAQVPFSLSDGGLGAVNVTCGVGSPNVQTFTHSSFQSLFFPNEWNAGDVTVHFESPFVGWIRRTAEVSVDDQYLTHLHPGTIAQLTAVVTNCHANAYLGCTWSGGNGISFLDSHSLNTIVSYTSTNFVQWATNHVSLVTEYVGGYAITNTTWFTVGQNTEPTPNLTISCQEVFFLNDADFLDGGECPTNRPERIRPVTLNLQAPYGTSGAVTLSAQGTACPVMFYIDNGVTNRITGTTVLPLEVTDPFTRMGVYTIYVSCPEKGNGVISATLTLDGGATLSDTASFKCIEPIRKLVTTEKVAGRFINPSRLVMGTNAVLQVGVNGDFDGTNVHWRVMSGSADISPTNGFTTTVVPTGTNEDVVVEARFNGDEIQPRFVLPVVTPRTIPIKVFVVDPPLEYCHNAAPGVEAETPWPESSIYKMIHTANEVFSQVGIMFNLIGMVTIIDEPNAWRIPYGRYVKGLDGKWTWEYSDEMFGFVLSHHDSDCIRIYFVGEIVSDEKVKAMATPYGVFVGRRATLKTLAHELGHELGLDDCYAVRPIDKSRPISNENCIYVPLSDNPVDKAFFTGIVGDWGEESGRGFYGKSDTRKTVMMKMLMHGNVLYSVGSAASDVDERGDIPTKCVISLKREAKTSDENFISQVGEKVIKEKNSEVYSR